jgi:transposase
LHRLPGNGSAIFPALPPAKALLADKGYDADCFRDALADRNFKVCIPPKSNRKIQIPYDKPLCRKRQKIENRFGKLKDWPIVGKTVPRTVF